MTELKLICREFDGFERSFRRQTESFHAVHPDVRVTCEFVPIEELYKRMIAENSGGYDLFLCVTDWLPTAIDNGLISNLDQWLEASPPDGWPDGWSSSMRGLQMREGSTYGIAYHDGPEILMVRGDLFESEEERKAFQERHGRELSPPKDWDEFLEVAQFFTRPEQGLWGACIAGYPDAHNNVYDFMIQLWSRGGQLLDAANRPAFHHNVGVEAATFLRDLVHGYKVVSPDCLQMDSVKSGVWYAEGNAAMMWNWSGFAAVAETADVSKIKGFNRCYGMPSGTGPSGRPVSLNIYWVLTVPSSSQNKGLAYEFIRHAASAENDKVTSMEGGNGTRLSTWRDPEVQGTYPYYRIIEEVHENVESPPKLAQFPEIAELLNHAMDNILNLRAEPATALAIAATKAETVLAAAGAKAW